MEQQSLALQTHTGLTSLYFISSSNQHIYHHITHYHEWTHPILLYYAPKYGGKTTLAQFLHMQNPSIIGYYHATQLPQHITHPFIIIDDAEKTHDADHMFFLLNHALQHKLYVMLCASQSCELWQQKRDILSRLNASPYMSLPDPDEALRKKILEYYFLQHQILFKTSHIQTFLTYAPQDYTLCHQIKIDIANDILYNGKKLTQQLITTHIKTYYEFTY